MSDDVINVINTTDTVHCHTKHGCMFETSLSTYPFAKWSRCCTALCLINVAYAKAEVKCFGRILDPS